MASIDPTLPHPKSLQSVIGAMFFASEHPLSLAEIKAALKQTAENAPDDSPAKTFAEVSSKQIKDLIKGIAAQLTHLDLGITLTEENEGFSLRTHPSTAPWVRAAIKAAPPQRLSRPALETLAIIAYRQPISRAEIESVRGVSADHTIRALTELNLVRTVGRSELPGRPFLYGTTATFLEHFGLKTLEELALNNA